MKLTIAVLAGDGIGPEVTNEATSILKAVADAGGHEFVFTSGLIGGVAIAETGSPLPRATLDVAIDSDAVLLGAVGDNRYGSLPPNERPEAGPAADSSGAGRLRQPAPVDRLRGAEQQLAAEGGGHEGHGHPVCA